MTLNRSILNSTKKILDIAEDDTAFDLNVITHINSAFSTLQQIGVGPVGGFMIEDEVPVWGDFLGDNMQLNSVQTYVYLVVRLAFDPPSASFHVTSLENQKKEYEWRLQVAAQPVPVLTDPVL